MFWGGPEHAAARLYRLHRAVPSRLGGKYKTLVRASRIHYVLADQLAEDARLFGKVSDWQSFQQKALPGSIVSEAEVYRPLRRLEAIAEASCERVTLETAIAWELGDECYATPDSAERLGSVVSRELLGQFSSSAEGARLREYLRTVQFRGADGNYYPAGRLVVGHSVGRIEDDTAAEERHRARFAPDGRVLHEGYGLHGVEFFQTCRGATRPSLLELADWVIEASTREQQIAALEYLADGQHGSNVLEELRRRGLGQTWLDPSLLPRSAAFRAVSDRTKDRLMGLFTHGGGSLFNWDAFCRQHPAVTPSAVEGALHKIHEWWLTERDRPQQQFGNRSWRAEYEARTYLDGPPEHL